MKRCPTCNRTFTDQNLSFCIDDGTPLAPVDTSEDEVTKVSSSSGSRAGDSRSGEPTIVAYQPPPAYVPPGTPPPEARRRAWPWIVGLVALVVLLLVGFGIAAAILIPRILDSSSNRNTANSNARTNPRDDLNSNRNESTATPGENTNDNDDSDSDNETAPPTDEEKVLADLTELEHEWTVANINADKKKLDLILADDYVGTSADGQSQGKVEYLQTIKRDTTIKNWEFEDLKVDLNGDRASLTGIIRLEVQNEPVAYRFTDKFVWRDGRWQATGSEVTPVK